MYNRLTRSATTSRTAIRAIGAFNPAPASATHKSEISKLAQENSKQREKIAELEATIEQLKTQHDQDLETIDRDLTKLAIWSAQEKELEATVRDQFIARAVKAEVRARRLAADLAAIKDKQVDRLEQPAEMRSNKLADNTLKCQEKQVDRLVQLVNERSSKLAGKAIDRQNILANNWVQPVDKPCNELAGKSVDRQNILENGLKQSDDERSVELRDYINKFRMVRVSNVNNSVRGSTLTDKLVDKHVIPDILRNQVDEAKNKITRYKEMAHKIVELLRAHQCRRQLHNQKPKSDLANSKNSKKRYSFLKQVCQTAVLGTLTHIAEHGCSVLNML
ncbi:hypothetical protein IWW46_002750 [Coemansia sp. RSA 2440]|nr:hypothetical protein J3F82_001166 [Coemansia sp. RSA 637]KAJ2442986.1 hypothetical protein IWW46_002750 [Coemansia sp. RSA 2440]